MTFDFSFNETQKMIQSSARAFFSRASAVDAVRANETSDRGFDVATWQAMAELGWLGIGIPAQHGGSEGTFSDRLPIYEEMGRQLFPPLHLEVVSLAAAGILRLGSPEQQRQYLRPIARGELILVPAIMSTEGLPGECRGSQFQQSRGGFRLNGQRSLVPFASSADRLIWVANDPTSGQAAAFLVDPAHPGVSLHRLQNLSRLPLYQITLNDVTVPDHDRLGPSQEVSIILEDIVLRAAVLQCACIVGASRRVLETTVEYARTREQFGNAIGKYQAVQYMISDMLIDLHRADLLTKQAAYRIERERPYRRQAAMAVAFCKRAAARIHRQAHEVHAGVAFIEDHELPLFSRRSKYWENHLGDARWYEDLAAAEMGLIAETQAEESS